MKNTMCRLQSRGHAWLALAALFLSSFMAQASSEVDGVFGLTPAGPANYVAIEIAHGPGQGLAGLSWYHNDATVNFPRLVLMEGQAESPPDLANSALVLEKLSGASLDWGTAALGTPVTSTTGTIFAVFAFPDGLERTAEGNGGGPGMGYRHKSGSANPRAYVSPDGQNWLRVHADYEIALETSWSAGKRAPVTLASLRAEADAAVATEQDEASPTDLVDRTPLEVYPNPLNPRTEIRLYLEKPARVQAEIFDLRGRRVATLIDASRPAGPLILVWEGTDQRGRQVSSGVYMLRAQIGTEIHRQRVALIR